MADLTKWTLVPVEPTPEMLRALRHEAQVNGYGPRGGPLCYRAMLSASPAPSLPTREEIARVLRETIKVDASGLAPAVVAHYIFGFDAAADRILALFAQPQEKTTDEAGANEPSGPYTCIRCLAGTENDCDICDACIEEAQRSP